MTRWEQFEVWIPEGTADWRLKSSWHDLQVAWAAARARTGPVRLVLAKYEGSKAIEKRVIAEVGAMRSEP